MSSLEGDDYLPRTPTSVGRMPPIKNMGYEVEFTDLWPLMVGGMLSAMLAVGVFVGWRPLPLPFMLIFVGGPLAGAHIYIKKLIEKAPPHREEYWAVRALWSKSFHFRREGPWYIVLLPKIIHDDAIAANPPTSDCRPPLLRLITRLEEANARLNKKI